MSTCQNYHAQAAASATVNFLSPVNFCNGSLVLVLSAIQVAKDHRTTLRLPFLWFRVLLDVGHLPGINFPILRDHTGDLTSFLGARKKFLLCFSLSVTGSHSPASSLLRPTLRHLSRVTSPTIRLHLLIAIAVGFPFRCSGNGNDRSSHVLLPSKIWLHHSLLMKRADLGISSFKLQLR